MSVKPGWARKRPNAARALPTTKKPEAQAPSLPTMEKPEWALAPKERPRWHLDRGEQRVLFVTFVGGVASLVVAAAIIGTAIAFDHALKIKAVNAGPGAVGGVIGAVETVYANWIIVVIVLVGLLLLRWVAPRIPERPVVQRAAVLAFWIIVVVVGLMAIAMVLAVIGVAAGVGPSPSS